jgi:hypothetical protein
VMGRGIAREFAMAIEDAVNGSPDRATVQWYAEKSMGTSSAMPLDDKGNQIKGVDAEAILLPDDPAGGVIHVNVAAGLWKTICNAPGMGHYSEGDGNNSFLFGGAYSVEHRTHIVFAYSGAKIPNNLDVRLVAFDKSGKAFPANPGGMNMNGTSYIGEYSVALPSTSILHWQLQVRTFDQWIEFRNVSLHAGKNTNVEIRTSDDK